MILTLFYGTVFGDMTSSDVLGWDVEMNQEEESAYHRAVMTGAPFEDYPVLEALRKSVYAEIERAELDALREYKDAFTMKCLGETEVDADEINAKVRARDPHTIAYFGLQGMTDAELDKWDVACLDRLPLIKDYQEDFVPKSPFDCGWRLRVWLPDNDECPGSQRIEEYLKDALCSGDLTLVEEITKGRACDYSGNIKEAALRIARQVGCMAYIQSHGDR